MRLNINEKRELSVSEESPQRSSQSNSVRTIIFMVVLSFICALILSVLASVLAKPQEVAKELDRSRQLLISAKIFDYGGYFLLPGKDGDYVPAKYVSQGMLEPASKQDFATGSDILEVTEWRLRPLFIDKKGNIKTAEEAKINLDEYISTWKKEGFYKAPEMLVYEILPNPEPGETKQDLDKEPAKGYVFPVNGFGLWDAIYGYIAVQTDGNTVIGIAWYDQKETPGLGANISEADWQSYFPGKHIFQESPDGKTNFKSAPLGITVVKGKVSEVYGDSPKSKSAVDGMAGATLTGNGVTEAYRDSLGPYRPFLIKVHQEWEEESKGASK